MNQLPPKELQEKRKELDRRIEECNYGKELVKTPVRVFIDNLGPNVNSAYRDYAPVISTDESVLMFTSRRPDTYGGGIDEDDGLYFEDIYVSYYEGNHWGLAKNVGKPLNSNTNDATVALSPDGQQLMTFNGKLNGGDILVSSLKGTEWTSPDDGPLRKYVNTKSWESAASFSFDGKTLYFVSDKEGGYGQHDIYMSKWDAEKERWGEAKILAR
jgi:Tol biopolymer transport system component